MCEESWLRSFEASVGALSLLMPENFAVSHWGGGGVEKAKPNIMTVFRLPGYFLRKKQAPQVFIYNPLPLYLQNSPSQFCFT